MSHSAGRVLLVVPSATSFRTFLTEAATEWRRRGGDIAVATGPELPGHQSALPSEGVEWLEMPSMRLGTFTGLARAAGSLRRHVQRWQPDVVHAHFAAAACVAAITRTAFRRNASEWMATFHGMHLTAGPALRSRAVSAVEVWAARRMSLVCVLNREDRDALGRRMPPERIHLHESCGVGCDLGAFDPSRFSPAERRATRERLGIPCDALVAAYVGRQVAFKGYPAAVRGFLESQRHGLEAWLVLVGSADDAHSSGLTAAEQRAIAGHPRIVRLGWQQDVAPFLAAADVTILPSTREGMPVSAMESLAVGTPVITVDSRGCRDVVRDGIDGVVLAEPAPSLIARTLLEFRDDPLKLQRFHAGALAGRARFDRRLFAGEQADIYSRLLHKALPLREGS